MRGRRLETGDEEVGGFVGEILELEDGGVEVGSGGLDGGEAETWVREGRRSELMGVSPTQSSGCAPNMTSKHITA